MVRPKNCPKIRAPKKVRTSGTNFSSFAGFYMGWAPLKDLGLYKGSRKLAIGGNRGFGWTEFSTLSVKPEERRLTNSKASL